jgi:hypothetical protein
VQLFAISAGAGVRWRLLAGNNRESGRGTEGFSDPETCRVAVKQLQQDVTLLRPRLRRAEPNRWVWELHLDAVPVAVAAHPFDRLIRCEQAVAQFVVQLQDATISPSLLISGARRWGSVAS